MANRKNLIIKFADFSWSAIRRICIFLVSLCVVIGICYSAYLFVYNNYIRPVDPTELTENDDSYVSVTIKSGSSVSSIAQQLVDAGIVRNKGVFQYTAELLSKGPKLQAGTFQLSPKMTVTEIIDTLSSMQQSRATMRIKLIEGMTVEEIAASLVEQGALEHTERFLALCKDGEAFAANYDFVQEAVEANQDGVRKYTLEGYLFADTYEIYVGSSEETIISKMLTRMNEMLSLARAQLDEENAMSIDQIVTLASMIEKEAAGDDMYRVSAVFHNRLDAGMKLQSDVTVHYITGGNNLVLTNDELSLDSPYNTYVYAGLPAGPVCNPGKYALEAAIYPDSDYVEDGYLYFCSGDPATGETVYAKTLAEHESNVAKYRPLWEAYDAAN